MPRRACSRRIENVQCRCQRSRLPMLPMLHDRGLVKITTSGLRPQTPVAQQSIRKTRTIRQWVALELPVVAC